MTTTELDAPSTVSAPAIAVQQRSAPPIILPEQPARLLSLDIFRGITIAAMLLVNNPGVGTAYATLEHAEWHGWTPTDLIFPFFLFIVGVAIPFSLAKRAATRSRGELLAGIWTRALALVLLGLLLQSIPFLNVTPLPAGFYLLKILHGICYVLLVLGIVALLTPWRSRQFSYLIGPIIAGSLLILCLAVHFANRSAYAHGLPTSFSFGNGMFTPYKLRIPGVLQRIGICYGVAATIGLCFRWRMILLAAILFMTVYSVLMFKMPARDHVSGSLTQEDNLARRIDERLFRTHNYGEYPDPEGLLSTLPAIATPLIGILVGLWLSSFRRDVEKCAGLLAMGVFVAILGMCLHGWLMPINKKIWTPSFVVFTAGMGMLGLGAIYWLADVNDRRRWALPFTIYGMNAIAAFVISGVVTRILYIIRIDDPETHRTVSLLTFCKTQIADGVHHFAAMLGNAPHLRAMIDTAQNTSLAYSIVYVLVILLLMSILYAAKIFIKV